MRAQKRKERVAGLVVAPPVGLEPKAYHGFRDYPLFPLFYFIINEIFLRSPGQLEVSYPSFL